MEQYILDLLEKLFKIKSLPKNIRTYDVLHEDGNTYKHISPTGILSMISDVSNIPEENFQYGANFHKGVEEFIKSEYKLTLEVTNACPLKYLYFIYHIAKSDIYLKPEVQVNNNELCLSGTIDLLGFRDKVNIEIPRNYNLLLDHKTCQNVNSIDMETLYKYALQLLMYRIIMKREENHCKEYLSFIDKQGNYLKMPLEAIIPHSGFILSSIYMMIYYANFLANNPIKIYTRKDVVLEHINSGDLPPDFTLYLTRALG